MIGLGAQEIRRLAGQLDLRPSKSLGQNFVVDANTCRRIATVAGIESSDHVLEVGPGLGSLTVALLEQASHVTAVEIDARLAEQLPKTIEELSPDLAKKLTVITADATTVKDVGSPTALVANLPYNVAVPVLLHLLENVPSLNHGVVMVQQEVADRLAAGPGSKTYGVPSVKAAWWAEVTKAGSVSRSVFWPVPNVDSGLVKFVRRQPPSSDRAQTFAVIDAAFAQRRKTLRAALAGWAGSAVQAEEALVRAGISPQERGEQLSLDAFVAIADSRL